MDDDNKNISRRRTLQILGLGGVVAATVVLPGKWTRPIVETIVVPAHAQASGGGGGGTGTTESPPLSTPPPSPPPPPPPPQ